jgi:hypothetical protein
MKIINILIALFLNLTTIFADNKYCLKINIELSANMITNNDKGQVFWEDDIARILCKNTNAKIIEDKKNIINSDGNKELLLKVKNSDNCRYEVLLTMNKKGNAQYEDTEGRDCRKKEIQYSNQQNNNYSSTSNYSKPKRRSFNCKFHCVGQWDSWRGGEQSVQGYGTYSGEAQDWVKKNYKSQCAKNFPFYKGGGGSASVGKVSCY